MVVGVIFNMSGSGGESNRGNLGDSGGGSIITQYE